ncbi:hypothetical protein SDC9_187045 [bioreactor metagenome]|uniref:Uncharacterized protein n=1 Tax=bioreactor metagenome TaxID=1076179 RepID=A0A645HKJ3_9ZZZZ
MPSEGRKKLCAALECLKNIKALHTPTGAFAHSLFINADDNNRMIPGFLKLTGYNADDSRVPAVPGHYHNALLIKVLLLYLRLSQL